MHAITNIATLILAFAATAALFGMVWRLVNALDARRDALLYAARICEEEQAYRCADRIRETAKEFER